MTDRTVYSEPVVFTHSCYPPDHQLYRDATVYVRRVDGDTWVVVNALYSSAPRYWGTDGKWSYKPYPAVDEAAMTDQDHAEFDAQVAGWRSQHWLPLQQARQIADDAARDRAEFWERARSARQVEGGKA